MDDALVVCVIDFAADCEHPRMSNNAICCLLLEEIFDTIKPNKTRLKPCYTYFVGYCSLPQQSFRSERRLRFQDDEGEQSGEQLSLACVVFSMVFPGGGVDELPSDVP